MDFVIPLSKSKHIDSVVTRLILAATSYFIWQERNNLVNDIANTVCLKLLSFNFKKNARVERMMNIWKLPTKLLLSES